MSALAISTHSVNEAFAEMLRPFTAKQVAEKLHLPSWRTVENWKEAKTSPQAKHVVAMLADDELCVRLLRMAGQGDEAHRQETAAALRAALWKVEGR